MKQNSSYIECLYVLELLRDVIETTDDERAIVSEAHAIVQEYKQELPEELLE